MSESEAKRDLRREMRARLRAMDAATHAEASRRICEAAADQPAFRRAECVALFAPLPTEPDVSPLVESAWALGKRAAFPLVLECSPRPELVWLEVRSWDELTRSGPLPLREPDSSRCPRLEACELDCAFIPGLAFDSEGHRLGHGGGFYDALLAGAPKSLACVGLFFEMQRVMRVPREPHDYQLRSLVTENGLITW